MTRLEVGAAANHLVRVAVGVDGGHTRLHPIDLVEQAGEVSTLRRRPGRLVEVELGGRSVEDREDRADVARGQLVEADPPAVVAVLEAAGGAPQHHGAQPLQPAGLLRDPGHRLDGQARRTRQRSLRLLRDDVHRVMAVHVGQHRAADCRHPLGKSKPFGFVKARGAGKPLDGLSMGKAGWS